MSKRTDLTIEMLDENASSLPKGITRKIRSSSVCTITEIIISDELAGLRIGKTRGRYITVETGQLSSNPSDFNEQAQNIADEIRSLIGKSKNGLIVGLGNSDITPDALGPMVISKVIATRHLHDEQNQVPEEFKNMARISAISPGVMGQTGIEAAEIIKAVCEKIRPDFLIAVDALACSDISRLGTTVQLSDTGISPGSGVQNRRKELSAATLDIPVIAIGVPTVVDMHTIVENITGSPPQKDLPNMMVTPRDIDNIVERAARLVSHAINKAVHPSLSAEDIEALS